MGKTSLSTFQLLSVSSFAHQSAKKSIYEIKKLKNKGGKFLKKLWCSVGGRVRQGNLVLSTELIISKHPVIDEIHRDF